MALSPSRFVIRWQAVGLIERSVAPRHGLDAGARLGRLDLAAPDPIRVSGSVRLARRAR